MAIEQEPISLNFENDEEAMQLLSLMKKGKLTSAKYADLLNLFVGNGWSLRDLITKCSHFNVRRKDENGRTCLHYAAEINDVDVVMFLITEFDLRPKETDFYGNTLLHCAADEGSLDVMRYLIDKHGCDPMAVNKKGKAVIHCAIKHINVVKYLIDICDCNLIKTLDCNHASLLHHAAWKGAVDVMKYLISECNCSPMSVCKDGKTVLHDAVTFNNAEVVEYLLSTGLCDPLAQDKHRKTPSQIAHERSRDLIPLFEKFGQVQLSYPVESYVNVFLLGYPGAGKSTLFHAITSTATGFHYFGSIRYGEKVKSCTAGIIPKKLQHIKLGNIILHDFAGHSEYYSSHSAVIENLMQGSDGVYLVVVNILENEAAKQLYQWLTVVNNEAQKSPNECVIIIVISHMDKKNDLVERRKREIQQIIRSKRYHGIVFIDCRRLGGSGFDSLFNKLSSACKSIRTRVKKLSLYCHMMYGLLEESNENILTFPDFMSAATCNDKFVLPNEKAQLLDILFSLHSTGLISVCKSGEKLWVIVNRRLLLFEVNGVLFAPQTFPEYSNIASNTGIVSVSSLTKYFPDHNTDMLICFLKDMKLCQELTSLLMTNLSHQTDDEMNEDSLLFFPCLLRNERPDEVGKQVYQFGWCLQCTKKHEFFPPRYFHVLSLYLAYKMTAPHDEGLSRHCMFWKNGLSWFNTYGVSTLVEIVDENQCALVLMCCETDDYIDNMVHLRRDVIKEVMRVYNEFCPNIEAKEYLIDSNDLAYPVKKPKERTLYSVGAVLSTIMKGGTHLVSDNGYINLKLVLNGESLLDISKLSILGGRGIKDIIGKCSNSYSTVKVGPLEKIEAQNSQEDIDKGEDKPVGVIISREDPNASQKEELIHMSSTGGFLVINKKEREEQCKIKTTYSDINSEQKLLGNVEKDKFCDSVMSKDIRDLDDVLEELLNAISPHFNYSKWDQLGLYLGLYKPTLDVIQDECQGKLRKCLNECLSAWLRGEDHVREKGGPSWRSLVLALDRLGGSNCQIAANIKAKYILHCH